MTFNPFLIQSFPSFPLHPTPGLITLVGSLDWVQHPVYTLEVIATDGGGRTSANHAQVTITVAGPDTSPPEFESSSYAFSVQENAAQVLVGAVKAGHIDPGESWGPFYKAFF